MFDVIPKFLKVLLLGLTITLFITVCIFQFCLGYIWDTCLKKSSKYFKPEESTVNLRQPASKNSNQTPATEPQPENENTIRVQVNDGVFNSNRKNPSKQGSVANSGSRPGQILPMAGAFAAGAVVGGVLNRSNRSHASVHQQILPQNGTAGSSRHSNFENFGRNFSATQSLPRSLHQSSVASHPASLRSLPAEVVETRINSGQPTTTPSRIFPIFEPHPMDQAPPSYTVYPP